MAQGAEEAIPYTYYKIIWLDLNVFEDENIKNLKILKDKGFTGLQPVKSINEFFNYLDNNLTKDNIIIITSGSMAEEEDGGPGILKQIQSLSKQQLQKIKNVIIFCWSLEKHSHWKDKYPNLVYSVVD